MSIHAEALVARIPKFLLLYLPGPCELFCTGVQVVVLILLTLTSQDLTTLRGVFTFIGIPPGRFNMLQTPTRVVAVHKVKRLTTYHSMMMMMMVLPVLKQ